MKLGSLLLQRYVKERRKTIAVPQEWVTKKIREHAKIVTESAAAPPLKRADSVIPVLQPQFPKLMLYEAYDGGLISDLEDEDDSMAHRLRELRSRTIQRQDTNEDDQFEAFEHIRRCLIEERAALEGLGLGSDEVERELIKRFESFR